MDPRQPEHIVVNDNDIHRIVKSYLQQNCFKETANTDGDNLERRKSGSNLCFAIDHEPVVEETAEAGSKKRRHKWTPTEDVVLCSAWLNTSKDATAGAVGNEQRLTAYWKRISAYFNSSPKLARKLDGFPKRESGQCKQRWRKIDIGVRKFVECYEAAKKQKTSEGSEDDVMKVAYEIYFNDEKVKFNLEHAWVELRNDQKWCAASTNKDEGSSKKRKVDDQSSSSHIVTQSADEPVARPEVVKAVKAKGKGSVSKSVTVESETSSLLAFQNMLTIKEKDNALKERLSNSRLLESLIGKKEPLDEMELALKKKLISEILSKK